MIVYLGADHRGFNLKEKVKQYLVEKNLQVEDLGSFHYEANDDYPDFAKLVGDRVNKNSEDRGILFCGSGVGVVVVANKFKNVRAATVFSPKQTYMARNDEDINVIGLSADLLEWDVIKEIVDVFLSTAFSSEERHHRRVDKIKSLEI